MNLLTTIQTHLSHRIEAGELSNDDMLKLIDHIGMYLNIQTIGNYAKSNNISYNGAKNFNTVVLLFGEKFIIDNE